MTVRFLVFITIVLVVVIIIVIVILIIITVLVVDPEDSNGEYDQRKMVRGVMTSVQENYFELTVS